MTRKGGYKMDERRVALARDAVAFERIFHVKLAKYWQGALGFNITGFDADVIKSGNMQMRAAVRQTYGQDAVALIQRLLGIHGA
jgi:hypothetical protein